MVELWVRDATEADLDRIFEIELASFTHNWSRESIAIELSGDDRRMPLVVLDGQAIVGFALVWIVADELHLVSLAVDPKRRRQGIGQKLVDEILATEAGQGASIMTLEVRASNDPALALYRRNGFIEVALRPRYYPDTNEDAVVMLKALRPIGDSGVDPNPFAG